MGIVVIGAVFVDIKGYPYANFIPQGRNAGNVETVHGGVGRNVAEAHEIYVVSWGDRVCIRRSRS